MNLNLGPLGPIPSQAPALLLEQNDDIRQRARHAVGSLRKLLTQLTPKDLLLRAALMDGGENWLHRLATDADALRHELESERRTLDELCREDAKHRKMLDGAAFELMAEAEAELTAQTKTMRDVIDAGESRMREALREAGVPSAEIDRIVTEKNADQRAQTEQRIEAASRMTGVLQAFLRDRLRRVEQLDESTRTAVEERFRIRCEQRAAPGDLAVR